jgi:hypothetical protein
MFATVLAPPRLIGITWSKCSSRVEPHWRHRPPSRADTAIFTSWVMARLARSPVGGGMGEAASGCVNGSWPGGRFRGRAAGKGAEPSAPSASVVPLSVDGWWRTSSCAICGEGC